MLNARAAELLEAESKRLAQKHERELFEAMVNYLLDNLQPYVWAKRREVISHFEQYFFQQFPSPTYALASDILLGREGRGRGLLETAGGRSWKHGNTLRESAGKALDLLCRLLDPKEHLEASVFVEVLKGCDSRHLLSMALDRHISARRGHQDNALKLVRFLRDLRPDVSFKLDDSAVPANDVRLSRRSSLTEEHMRAAAAASAAASAAAETADNKDETALAAGGSAPGTKKFSRRVSTRACMEDLVRNGVLKDRGTVPPPAEQRPAAGAVPRSPSSSSSGSNTAKTPLGSRLRQWFGTRRGKGGKGGTGRSGKDAVPLVFGVPLAQVLQAAEHQRLAATAAAGGGTTAAGAAASTSEPTHTRNRSSSAVAARELHLEALVVPPVVLRCCEQVELRGMQREGIFRLPGNVRVVNECKTDLDEGRPVDWAGMRLDTVASLLKQFLRELPEPVVPFDLYSEALAIERDEWDDTARVERLKRLGLSLPAEHRALLAYLLAFLDRVASHQHQNRMTRRNLAMVFAPNLLRPRVESYEEIIANASTSISVLAFMIAHHKEAFPEYPFPAAAVPYEDAEQPERTETTAAGTAAGAAAPPPKSSETRAGGAAGTPDGDARQEALNESYEGDREDYKPDVVALEPSDASKLMRPKFHESGVNIFTAVVEPRGDRGRSYSTSVRPSTRLPGAPFLSDSASTSTMAEPIDDWDLSDEDDDMSDFGDVESRSQRGDQQQQQ